MTVTANPLLEVNNLTKHFAQQGGMWGRSRGVVRAVNDISFSIAEGETLGLVGESGSGKSTTGRLILRLIEASSGKVKFAGQDVLTLPREEMRALRRQMQIVFQDPYGAFNPRMTIGGILGEALELRDERMDARAREETISRLLAEVHLPTDVRSRYPHEFSGGQRQRLGIARALAMEPRFIVADEPVSALDVSTQAGIVNLLLDLQKKRSLTMLFISHDLSVVRVLADRVAVMFAGRILELAPAESLFANPLQPYTQELIAAVPAPDPAAARRDVPAPEEGVSVEQAAGANSPGCPYAGRCVHTMEVCREQMPPLVDYAPRLGEAAPHWAACHWTEKRLPTTPLNVVSPSSL
jgi:oligopeptide/dipeptide ABC transporter ATP-binding protein